MGLFPTNAVDGQQVTNANGTTFEYVEVDNKWIIVVRDVVISDAPYDATGWNNNLDGASKNVIRDEMETKDHFVWRTGAHGYDYTIAGGTLTANSAWVTKDVSAIVPSGASAILMNVYFKDNTNPITFTMRESATNTRIVGMYNQVVNQYTMGELVVGLTASRTFQYKLITGTDVAGIQIIGW